MRRKTHIGERKNTWSETKKIQALVTKHRTHKETAPRTAYPADTALIHTRYLIFQQINENYNETL